MEPAIKAPDNNTNKPDWLEELDLPPAKRELRIHYQNQNELRILRIKYDNAQNLLRELEQLRHEKHASITNSVISTFVITAGGLALSGQAFVIDLLGTYVIPVGVCLIGCGTLFGVIKPPIESFIWRIFLGEK